MPRPDPQPNTDPSSTDQSTRLRAGARLRLPAAGAALALGLLAAPVAAQHAAPVTAAKGGLPLKVSSARIVAVPPGVKDTAVHATLRNTGQAAVVLTGVQTAVAAHSMLMVTTKTTTAAGTMMGMKEVPTLTVPAGGTLKLFGEGPHLMLMGLKRPLKVGEKITVTVRDGAGRRLSFAATVTRP